MSKKKKTKKSDTSIKEILDLLGIESFPYQKKKKKKQAKKMTVKKSVRLECKSKGHFKFYSVELTEEGLNYLVTASYGRIGHNPQHQIKYEGIYLSQASQEFTDLVKEKLKKGYIKIAESVEPDKKIGYSEKYIMPPLVMTNQQPDNIATLSCAPKTLEVEQQDTEEDELSRFDLDLD